jgi:hypothetical protein
MSDTGKYYIIDKETGRKFLVEPIIKGNKKLWGDLNPSTKKVEGTYGNKHKGAIEREESIISKDNGFKNIIELETGVSPDSYISNMIKNGQ